MRKSIIKPAPIVGLPKMWGEAGLNAINSKFLVCAQWPTPANQIMSLSEVSTKCGNVYVPRL